MKQRVVITGMGAVSCVGQSAAELWDALREGRPDFRPLNRFDTEPFRFVYGGQAWDFQADESPDAPDLAAQFLIAACREALQQSGVAPEEAGLAAGTNFGPAQTIERYLEALHAGDLEAAARLAPRLAFENDVDSACGALGLGGPRASLSLSCASGNAAIGRAVDWIRRGDAYAAIAAGYDSITKYTWTGLSSLRVINASKDEPDKVRPFDKRRQGTLFSEGAAALVLEPLERAQRRGAEILAEVLGYGMNNNAFHIAHASKEGAGTREAMRAALEDAGVEPSEVDYINAHGTGTKPNDPIETAAIKALLGEHAYEIVVSSNKSVVGHGMGAASSFEAISTVYTLCEGVAPPTINLDEPDPDCDLDYAANRAKTIDARIALSNAAGIGGCNAAVVLGRYEP